MRDVIIVGTGAVAAELTSYINHNNSVSSEKINLIGYLEYDYNIEPYYKKYGLEKPVLGDIDNYTPLPNQEFLIGFTNINSKKIIIDKLLSKKALIGNFIHFTSIVDSNAVIGVGNIIYPHCIVGPKVNIGNYNMITSYSFISHDCTIGDNNFLSTAGLAGRVTIGNDNFFGIRSTVIPSIKIGNNNTIQAGMVVNKNLNDNNTVFYRYKEEITIINN